MKRYLEAVLVAMAAAVLVMTGPAARAAGNHLLTQGQARQLARMVARHEHIDLGSQWIEFDSMDVGAPYLPGFSSFIVLREASTPGPDTTLRRYAVNRTTGNVWEMMLCRRYDFAKLSALRKRLTGHAEATAAADAAERKQLGCEKAQGQGRSKPGRRASGSARH